MKINYRGMLLSKWNSFILLSIRFRSVFVLQMFGAAEYDSRKTTLVFVCPETRRQISATLRIYNVEKGSLDPEASVGLIHIGGKGNGII